MQIIGLTLEDVAAQNLEEKGEPVEVECTHDGQEDTVELEVGSKLIELAQVTLLEDEVDHWGQDTNARVEPSNHAHDEDNGT